MKLEKKLKQENEKRKRFHQLFADDVRLTDDHKSVSCCTSFDCHLSSFYDIRPKRCVHAPAKQRQCNNEISFDSVN